MSNLSEAEVATALITRILAGDTSAEGEMVERYHQGMLYMLRHRTKNPTLAEDIAQETWRIVIEKARNGDLKDPSKLAAYIVQTAKNQLLMFYRGKYFRVEEADENSNEPANPAEEPENVLEQMNTAKVVRVLLTELKSERDRDLILRYYLKDEDKETLCADFGLSELHFNRVLHRARQRFKQLWLEYS